MTISTLQSISFRGVMFNSTLSTRKREHQIRSDQRDWQRMLHFSFDDQLRTGEACGQQARYLHDSDEQVTDLQGIPCCVEVSIEPALPRLRSDNAACVDPQRKALIQTVWKDQGI